MECVESDLDTVVAVESLAVLVLVVEDMELVPLVWCENL
jgi:hypothetical protein